jgi:uncharacterized damage-inducible protein DinB
MSSRDTAPPATSDLSASTGSERDVLDRFLDYQRQNIVRKIHGLPDDKAKQHLVGSLTTLAGLLKHLAVAERTWFQSVLRQRSYDGSDDDWQVLDDDTVAGLIAEYEHACTQSRDIAAGYDLDHAVPHAYLGQVSLRWIYVHMIEETARHTGHADILREQTDGSTGAY